MRMLIVGASRGVGLEAVRLGLALGHDVRALARSAGRMAPHPRLERRAGDAADPAALAAALEGVDSVIQALGMAPGLRRAVMPVSLFSDTTRILVGAMARAGVRRLVAVTGFGAGDSRASLSPPERALHRLLLGPVYDDKDRQEAIIRASPLDWLIVRPTILTNGPPTGRCRVLVEPRSWRNGLISRADVADVLVREATAPTLTRVTPVLAY